MTSRKITAVGCATLGAVVIGSSVLAALMIDGKSNNQNVTPNHKPLNRGENYEHYNLNLEIDHDVLREKLMDSETDGNKQSLLLSETKFRNNIETIVRNVLRTNDRFKSNADKYTLDIHYEWNKKNILVDVVWYLNTSNYRFYDQFQIIMTN